MSQLEVDKIIPQSGTTLTIGETGDTISFASGVLPSLESLTITGDLTVDTDTLFVDSTNNEVGIGTTTPSQKLDVQGNAFIGGVVLIETPNNIPLQIESTDAFSAITLADTGGSIKIETSAGVIKFETGGDASTPGTNATEAMRIDSSGNVGIGTSSPSRELEVVGSIGASGAVNADNGTTQTQIGISGTGGAGVVGTASNHDLEIRTNNTEQMLIDTSGRVGIGTSNPNAELHVADTSANAVLRLESSDTGSGIINFDDQSAINRGRIVYDHSNNSMSLTTNASEAMRINSSGVLLVGTTTIPTGASAGNGLRLAIDTGTGTARDGMVINADGGTGDDCFAVLDNGNSGAKTCVIFGNGDIENTNNSYTGFSDERLKQQIVDSSSQWDDIKALQVRKYKMNAQVEKWGEDAPFQLGVIAQELEASGMEGLVKTSPRDGHKSVKYSILYMKAVKALQEAMERIETLESTVADLTTRLETLENE